MEIIILFMVSYFVGCLYTAIVLPIGSVTPNASIYFAAASQPGRVTVEVSESIDSQFVVEFKSHWQNKTSPIF